MAWLSTHVLIAISGRKSDRNPRCSPRYRAAGGGHSFAQCCTQRSLKACGRPRQRQQKRLGEHRERDRKTAFTQIKGSRRQGSVCLLGIKRISIPRILKNKKKKQKRALGVVARRQNQLRARTKQEGVHRKPISM